MPHTASGARDLSLVLGIDRGSVVSIVGAGGKTTTMYRLCAETVRRGLTVVSTTTTAIQYPQPSQSPRLILESDTADLSTAVRNALRTHRHVTVAGAPLRADKLRGISPDAAAALSELADVVVIEADGARHSAIKAPAAHEPVAPFLSTHFLSVAGLHALGRPLNEASHRPELAAAICSQTVDSAISPSIIVTLLSSGQGGLQGKPVAALAWAVLTHLTERNEPEARTIALAVLRAGGYEGAVALASNGAIALYPA